MEFINLIQAIYLLLTPVASGERVKLFRIDSFFEMREWSWFSFVFGSRRASYF
jgi:hypothetical protein